MEPLEKNQGREVSRIFNEHMRQVSVRVDWVFFIVLILEWVGATALGFLAASGSWREGARISVESGIIGFFFGALFAVPPMVFIKVAPGEKVTRYAVAFAQVCFSILLIYLTGGRIETHFHIFVSLAALSFYRDKNILWASAVLVVLDHIIRGLYVPMTIYGEASGVQWRWLEHAAWVFFESVILSFGIGHIRQQDMLVSEARYDLEEARRQAVKSSTMKTTYLSNMSHEIRTPLNSILGFAEVLKETKLNQDQEVYVDTITRCSDSLMQLINGILDISKIENGVFEIDRHQFSFLDLHDDIYKMFVVRCTEKGLELILEVDPSLHRESFGDSHRIRQVLMNLVSNAVKFTDAGSIRIEVRRCEKTNHTLWSVRDTGKGIKEDSLENLFTSFYQEDASISRKYGGSGLGLMISKSLIELMGGSITVESTFGEGTSFNFSLPIDYV